MRKLMRVAYAALLVLGTGCSAPAPAASAGFPEQALESMSSQKGAYDVVIRTSPQPPSQGAQSVEYTLTDRATGQAASGLTLTVVPWMPAMAHGAPLVPSVTETSPGVYVATDVAWYMPGEWVLRTTITNPAAGCESGADCGADGGASGDYVEPSFEIP
jgi:hypothetical protein